MTVQTTSLKGLDLLTEIERDGLVHMLSTAEKRQDYLFANETLIRACVKFPEFGRTCMSFWNHVYSEGGRDATSFNCVPSMFLSEGELEAISKAHRGRGVEDILQTPPPRLVFEWVKHKDGDFPYPCLCLTPRSAEQLTEYVKMLRSIPR